MIVLRALGSAEIETGVATVTPSQGIVFAAALYLVSERGKRVNRARLSSLLWPRVAEKPRAHRMRQTILQLKKQGIIVRADRNTLQLSQYDARSDVDDLSSADSTSVLKHDSLEFLPGYNPRLSESFRDWVDTKRGEAHAAATRILVRELERLRLQADWASVEKAAAKCLCLDPYNEVAVLAQAEASAMRGGKRAAVSILDRYIADVGEGQSDLKLPATLLRRRVLERIPDRPVLLNADPPFVGREAEMQALTGRFNQARIGNGSATLLVGEPGIGKTRLCAELARFAELQGAQVQRAACRRTDIDRPLSLFVDIVPQLREMPGALGCEPDTFTWLKRLTEFERRTHDNWHSVDSEMLFQNVRAALFDLLDSVAEERCLVVLIEDIQWLDDASAKILARMVEWCTTKRIVFLLNSRPNNNSFLDLAEQARVESIALGPLSSVASGALLQSVTLRPGDVPPLDFTDWCLAVAEGNPFFLQELARQWIETGQRHQAPPSVTKVLQERLSRLTAAGLQVLQTCAVLGDHASLDRVERVLEYPPHRLLSAVEELNNAAMLGLRSGNTDTADGLLQPRHDFLASAAVSRLAPVSLAFIHRRSADILEEEIAQDKMPTTLLWACASHRHQAGDRERARTLSISCAEHLLDLGLAREAATAFQKALDYSATEEQRLEVLPRLASAYQLNGEWSKTKDVLQSASQIARKAYPFASCHNEFELLLFAARHHSELDFHSLLSDLTQCASAVDASAEHRVDAAVMALKIAADIGPPEILDSIYGNVEPLFDDPEVKDSSRLEANIIYRTSRGRAVIPIEELQRFAESARDNGEIAYSDALLTAASACRISGRYQEGMKFVARAFEHDIAHKRPGRISRHLVSELTLHIAAGEIGRADSVLRRLIDCPISADDDYVLSELQTYKARIALEKGDITSASEALTAAQAVPLTQSPRRRAHSLALRLRIRLKQSAPQDEIRLLVSELEREHRKVRVFGGEDFEAYALYLGSCSLGDSASAAARLTEYVRFHRRSEWPLPDHIRDLLEAAPINHHASDDQRDLRTQDLSHATCKVPS
jgi:DNA-binding SARP family transcriptional activator/tetratricopeptide (TPR) repeat protein